MKRLLLLALTARLATSVAPIQALPWDKKKPNYIDQEAALEACFEFAEKVLYQELKNPGQ